MLIHIYSTNKKIKMQKKKIIEAIESFDYNKRNDFEDKIKKLFGKELKTIEGFRNF